MRSSALLQFAVPSLHFRRYSLRNIQVAVSFDTRHMHANEDLDDLALRKIPTEQPLCGEIELALYHASRFLRVSIEINN